jgi:shikimate kinase
VLFASPKLRPSTLVELIGPPGAGKSSVFRALAARSSKVEGHDPPELGELGLAALFCTLPLVVGTLVGRGAIDRLTPSQLCGMVYLKALPAIVERGAPGNGSILVLDQGPLYLLNRPRLLDDRLTDWRQGMFETWALLLDAVVWLDAPDAVLVERIASRSTWHRLKGAPPETAASSLANTRALHEETLSRLEGRAGGPVILRFDTSRVSSDTVAEALLQTVDESVRARDSAHSCSAAPSEGTA